MIYLQKFFDVRGSYLGEGQWDNPDADPALCERCGRKHKKVFVAIDTEKDRMFFVGSGCIEHVLAGRPDVLIRAKSLVKKQSDFTTRKQLAESLKSTRRLRNTNRELLFKWADSLGGASAYGLYRHDSNDFARMVRSFASALGFSSGDLNVALQRKGLPSAHYAPGNLRWLYKKPSKFKEGSYRQSFNTQMSIYNKLVEELAKRGLSNF